jgi:hypothetical protein
MQKISSYLYPNRIELLADLAGFSTEYTNVYQRTIKIYKGVDNVIELDVKNADQKRINITTSIDNMRVNLMDASGNAVGVYEVNVYPQDGPKKGLAYFTIDADSLLGLDHQFLKYSVTHTVAGNPQVLYGDTRFGAIGTIELVGSATSTLRSNRTYDSFSAEIDLKGFPTWHSSAIPAKFYEAVPTETIQFDVDVKGLTGNVWIEATKQSTINTEAFKKGDIVYSFPDCNDTTDTLSSPDLTIGDYQYFRVSYGTQLGNGIGAAFNVTQNNGDYDVVVRTGGTGYAVGSQLKVFGSAIGGTDGVNDLIITVTSVDGASTGFISSYSVSSATGISWTGNAAPGTSTFVVTGKNVTGTVDKITVN